MRIAIAVIGFSGCALSYTVKLDRLNSEKAEGKKYFVIASGKNVNSEEMESGKRIIWDLSKVCTGEERIHEIAMRPGSILSIECK
ncbi:MAG TPA: hypothetical protein PK453_27835 [Leptospiraceae bacterium]|nr:hypothetical protein [Leptospiraceae bacterium]HNI99814.1 hypothetical protein [Leptospiraceae bacterium]HNO27044.1 hypothetical protein [Leptospiraceae bacterium]